MKITKKEESTLFAIRTYKDSKCYYSWFHHITMWSLVQKGLIRKDVLTNEVVLTDEGETILNEATS